MENNNVKIFLSVVGLLILGVIATVLIRSGSNGTPIEPGKYDVFAQCLEDKGAVFYGAWWCPHCNDQKKLFGTSAKLLPYVECYKYPDTKNQLPVCRDKKIASYPTWLLADGTQIPNENGAGVTLKTLAEKTSCQLPE